MNGHFTLGEEEMSRLKYADVLVESGVIDDWIVQWGKESKKSERDMAATGAALQN